MQLVSKEGTVFSVPVNDSKKVVINSFRKWDRAFRVYAGIYTKANPGRANESLQYMNTIESAADTYCRDDVYEYDQLFRDLMEEFPDRNWGAIYQQGWSLMLKEKSSPSSNGNSLRNNHTKSVRKFKDKEGCWRYNKGKCTFGQNCRFDHRCAHCS